LIKLIVYAYKLNVFAAIFYHLLVRFISHNGSANAELVLTILSPSRKAAILAVKRIKELDWRNRLEAGERIDKTSCRQAVATCGSGAAFAC
jgi:hypothetical protein